MLSLHRLRNKRHTFLCGDAGPLSIGIIVNHKMGNTKEMKQLVTRYLFVYLFVLIFLINILYYRLKSLDKDVLNVLSDLPNEYLYGRAGYLFAILYANKNVAPPPFDDSFVRSVNLEQLLH